jgi:hypothetical protein
MAGYPEKKNPISLRYGSETLRREARLQPDDLACTREDYNALREAVSTGR